MSGGAWDSSCFPATAQLAETRQNTTLDPTIDVLMQIAPASLRHERGRNPPTNIQGPILLTKLWGDHGAFQDSPIQ